MSQVALVAELRMCSVYICVSLYALVTELRICSVYVGVLCMHLSPGRLAGAGWGALAGWSLSGVGPDRGLRGRGRRGWCEEWGGRGEDHPVTHPSSSYH
jgi:hypothetical protein